MRENLIFDLKNAEKNAEISRKNAEKEAEKLTAGKLEILKKNADLEELISLEREETNFRSEELRKILKREAEISAKLEAEIEKNRDALAAENIEKRYLKGENGGF
jgi:hypothetical protein